MPINRSLVKKEIACYVDAIMQAVQTVDAACADVIYVKTAQQRIRSHRELTAALEGQELSCEAKSQLISEVLADMPQEIQAVMSVMASRDNLDYASRIIEELQQRIFDDMNTVIVEVVTAIALDDDVRGAINAAMSSRFPGKHIHLEEQVDPAIIGGIIVTAQGKRLDASVSAQLVHAKSVLSSVSTGGDR